MKNNERTSHKFHAPNTKMSFIPSVFLGIDPGIANVGYAIVHRENHTVNFDITKTGIIRTTAKESQPKRLLKISNTITDILEAHNIEAIAIEMIFHNRNITSSITTAQVIGIVQLAAAERGLPVYLITPQKAKASFGLNRKATKKQMIQRVRLITNATTKQHHAADAAAVAIAGILEFNSCQEKLKEGKTK